MNVRSLVCKIHLVVSMFFTVGLLQADPQNVEKRIVTGSGEWQRSDGSTIRARYLGFSKKEKIAFFRSQAGKTVRMKMADFSPKDQEKIQLLSKRELLLCQMPGLNVEPDFTKRMQKNPSWREIYRIGKERVWVNLNGKKINASVINCTDTDVALLISGKDNLIWRQKLSELSKPDHDYLRRLLKGDEPLYPNKLIMSSHHHHYDGAKYESRLMFDGQRLHHQPSPEGRFEVVMKAAMKHVQYLCPDGGLELVGMDELFFVHEFHGLSKRSCAQKMEPQKYQFPYYHAVFMADKKNREVIEKVWPYTTSPEKFDVTGSMWIHFYFLPDGKIVEVERIKK